MMKVTLAATEYILLGKAIIGVTYENIRHSLYCLAVLSSLPLLLNI
jgi:hypothetical protein